jgi:di/tricarboxylate transporter
MKIEFYALGYVAFFVLLSFAFSKPLYVEAITIYLIAMIVVSALLAFTPRAKKMKNWQVILMFLLSPLLAIREAFIAILEAIRRRR